mgnify:CR=1 FL=1|jgi:hypothetical protein
MLGRDVNFDGLNKQIEKLRKNINDTYKPDLIDEDKSKDRELRELVKAEHLKVFKEFREELLKEGHVSNPLMQLENVKGTNGDELMLLSHISGQYHQSIPTWEDM